jgi:hypothetical protein
MKIQPVGTELFQADVWADGQTDTRKIIVTYRNSSNAPKNRGIVSLSVTMLWRRGLMFEQHPPRKPHNSYTYELWGVVRFQMFFFYCFDDSILGNFLLLTTSRQYRWPCGLRCRSAATSSGIAVSYPTQGGDVRLLCLFALCRERSLRLADQSSGRFQPRARARVCV